MHNKASCMSLCKHWLTCWKIIMSFVLRHELYMLSCMVKGFLAWKSYVDSQVYSVLKATAYCTVHFS